MKHYLLLCIAVLFSVTNAFHAARLSSVARSRSGARSMTALFDGLAALSLAHSLSNGNQDISRFSSQTSFPVAVVETKQGMYKEYSVDVVDDSALDKNIRGYKTAEETDDSKTKYWAILGVLLFGSFVIPMVQYYWYVAEED